MEEMDGQALRAQSDEEYLNNFIQENRRFILGCASRTTHRFLTWSDDEYAVAMIAFAEAVKSYRDGKGPFRAFAGMVIRRRILDYLSTEKRHAGEIPVAPYSIDGEAGDEEEISPLTLEIRRRTEELSVPDAGQGAPVVPGRSPVRDEIEAVQEILQAYGFSFFDLAECSPKADKTKKVCAAVVGCLLTHPDLFRQMQKDRTLPIKEICEIVKSPRKILERHRRYIIAAAEILNGEYPLLAEYMDYLRKALAT